MNQKLSVVNKYLNSKTHRLELKHKIQWLAIYKRYTQNRAMCKTKNEHTEEGMWGK